MNVLVKKMLRTIWNTRGQFLAVTAVVTVGITVYMSMTTSYFNLNASKDRFYRENNFADYYFHVVRAPQQVIKQVESLPGVAVATGRLQKDMPVVKEGDQRATARITSYALPMEGEVNRLQLTSGRLFEKNPQGGGVEVLTDIKFASANGLSFGDLVYIVADGRKAPLTLVGTGTSPEFTIAMKDAATLMPDPRTFGLIMMPHQQAQQIMNLPGQINQVIIKVAPGFNEELVASGVKNILEPYGNLASYPRSKQLSHAVLQGELDGLKASSRFMPFIFLGIAAAIQMVMLGRMIKGKRLEIGVLKALGYSSRSIILHYTGYSVSTSLLGCAMGTILGAGLTSAISGLYAEIFNLPQAIGSINYQAVLYGSALSLGVGATTGLIASRGVVKINPADSMRPNPPKKGGRIFLERWEWIWKRLDSTWKMSLRTAFRNRGRFTLVLLGVTFSVGMLVMSLFSNDTIDYMIKKQFFENQGYDYLVRFSAPLKEHELLNISRIEGVLRAEPIFEIPVRVHYNGNSQEDSLQGLNVITTLKKITDKNGKPLSLPEEGVLISEKTAVKLGVREGDWVEVETLLGTGPSRRAALKIAGVNQQLVGGGSFVSIDQANDILQEKSLVSGVMLKVDPGTFHVVEKKLDDMTAVSSVLSRQKELANFNKNLEAMIYSILIMVMFAMVMGFAIVYNSSVISFSERKRELASLRVIGFSNREVSGLLLKENVLQSLLGVALGLPLGRLMTQGYISAVSTDLFTMPLVIYPQTYFLSAAGGLLFIWVAHLVAVRGVKKLDLVDVLKNRD